MSCLFFFFFLFLQPTSKVYHHWYKNHEPKNMMKLFSHWQSTTAEHVQKPRHAAVCLSLGQVTFQFVIFLPLLLLPPSFLYPEPKKYGMPQQSSYQQLTDCAVVMVKTFQRLVEGYGRSVLESNKMY